MRRDGLPMKKLACLLFALCLTVGASALADTDLSNRSIADGTVTAAAFEDLTAPFSGTLAPFDLDSGDAVAAGDVLMRYVTLDVYATESGVVKAVFVKPGDDATAAVARYGAVLGVEPTVEYQVAATTSGAYNDNDNKLLHLGETLYFKTSGTNGADGEGRVVQVSQNSYTVDVLKGDFDLNDDVTLYRRTNHASDSNVGKGKVVRRDALLVAGAGRVVDVYVKEGDPVTAGEKLASFVSADAAPEAATSKVTCDTAGVVRTVSVAPGQQVWKGQVLCRIDRTDALEVTADVDEVDLGALKVGDLVPVTLDMQEGNVLMGTVTQISALGVSRQNAAYFTVHAAIPAGSAMLGASASLYLPKQ